jgi:hypothetical protein
VTNSAKNIIKTHTHTCMPRQQPAHLHSTHTHTHTHTIAHAYLVSDRFVSIVQLHGSSASVSSADHHGRAALGGLYAHAHTHAHTLRIHIHIHVHIHTFLKNIHSSTHTHAHTHIHTHSPVTAAMVSSVPPAKRPHSNFPMGPFQMIVLARLMAVCVFIYVHVCSYV